jgi:hypothetical protein
VSDRPYAIHKNIDASRADDVPPASPWGGCGE